MFFLGKKAFAPSALWLIRTIGVLVPRRLRSDWRQEWEADGDTGTQGRGDAGTRQSILRLAASPPHRVAASRPRMRCCCNQKDWRTKCFKTCVTACEC